MAKRKNAEAWAEAKKRCRLNEADIRMAKELGMTPKSLIKNIPARHEKWKDPVKVWVRELYENKFGKVLTSQPKATEENRKQEKREQHPAELLSDEELPF